jgi:hypothetical protein
MPQWPKLSWTYLQRMRETDYSREEAQTEMLADLISGRRKSVGLTPHGTVEEIPSAWWVAAESADADSYNGQCHGDVLADFRRDSLLRWDHIRYVPAYASIRISPLEATSTDAPTPPKRPVKSADALAWDMALDILENPEQRPARGRGRLTALAEMVRVRLEAAFYRRKLDTVVGYLSPGLADWERKNPEL